MYTIHFFNGWTTMMFSSDTIDSPEAAKKFACELYSIHFEDTPVIILVTYDASVSWTDGIGYPDI